LAIGAAQTDYENERNAMTKIVTQNLLKKKEAQLAEAEAQLEHDKSVLNLLEKAVPFYERKVRLSLLQIQI